MKVWILYQGYWDDSNNYVNGVTTDENTAIHWEKTKPKGIASRTSQMYETIDDILNLDRTINSEERRRFYEK